MIVIPMAGQSRRFFDAGFTQPKFMLDVSGKTVFRRAVESFATYFCSDYFLFIARDISGTKEFIAREIEDLSISNWSVVFLSKMTRGQAETVAEGLHDFGYDGRGAITIFNIDTFRPNFRHPAWIDSVDGYLETFRASGDQWSFVRPMESASHLVAETAEKRRISPLCSTGLYYFSRARDFFDAHEAAKEQMQSELFVAPLYNRLIAKGLEIGFTEVEAERVICCGTPDEYYACLGRPELFDDWNN